MKLNNKILIVVFLLGTFLVSGCFIDCTKGLDPICYYNKMYESCINNNPNQIQYCQCWTSCDLEGSAVGKDCNIRCKDNWILK